MSQSILMRNAFHRTVEIALCGLLFVAIGCSSSSSPSSNGSNVVLQSAFSGTSVTPNRIRVGGPNHVQGFHGLFVDSLEVTSARILIKDIKLHHEENDSLSDDRDETINVGPFLITFDSSAAHTETSATIPPGVYDRIKFEIHKFNHDEDKHEDLDKDDSASMFEASDGYTFVLSGWVWKNGARSPFTYYSKVTANVTWRFPKNITINSGSEARLLVKLDPVAMFHVIGFALDPRDSDNRSVIDAAIQYAMSITKY